MMHTLVRPSAGAGVPPWDLASFRDRHAGETIVVCGCGTSLPTLPRPDRFVTIGVNDVGRLFDPTYLVVLNPRRQFSGDRFRHVEQSRARAVFTQLDLGLARLGVVRIRLGRYGGTEFDDPTVLHYTRDLPYLALCLAVHMGAVRIGLIGVDFTDHHFFDRIGRHALASQLRQINVEYEALNAAFRSRSDTDVNLSAESRVTAFPNLRPLGKSENRGAGSTLKSARFDTFGGANVAMAELGQRAKWWSDLLVIISTKSPA